MCFFYELMHIKYLREQDLFSIDMYITIDFVQETLLLMIYNYMLMIYMMSSPVKFSTFFMGKLRKGRMFRKNNRKYGLAQFYELFQVLQEFSTKNKFF